MNDILQKIGIKTTNPGIMIGDCNFELDNSKTISSINPANEKELAKVIVCNIDHYRNLILKAKESFEIWRNIPAPKRGEIIRQIGNALRDNKQSLGMLVTLETGKSLQEGLGEIQEAIDIADLAVGQARMLYGLTMHSERKQHRMYEQWHPYGLVGIISAFNFPVAVWAWNAFIAAICGNVSIWKPSEKTPLSAIGMYNICNEVLQANQIPPIFGLFLPESHDISKEFLQDQNIPLVSFTGSINTGKSVSEIVAKRLGKSILELGGNNAVIVDEKAHLEKAILAVLFGAIGTAGQRCTTTRRVFVHTKHYDQFLSSLIQAYKNIKIGDPMDINNHMGPLIDQSAIDIFTKTISLIKNDNGVIEFGGNTIKRDGFYVEPTIITGLKTTSALLQEEHFVPIVYIIPFKTLEHAIYMQNDVTQGLSSAIFTDNLQSAEKFLSTTGSDCGIANVNIGTSGAEIGGAFGGEKQTGGGRESGSDCWKGYMRRQTNTINWSDELELAQNIEFKINIL